MGLFYVDVESNLIQASAQLHRRVEIYQASIVKSEYDGDPEIKSAIEPAL